jgi:hypothetical protein
VLGDWQEACRIVLHIDPEHYPDRARRAFAVISPGPNGQRGWISAAA